MHLNKYISVILGLVLSIGFGPAALANSDLDAVMERASPPAGVVFEVVDWEEEYLAIAIPWVNEQIIALREKYPGLEVAVVSHGREQFALLSDTELAFPEIHAGAKRLITDHDVKLELCLGHASMKGFNQSDFPDYVDIDASGPSQIAAYEALGYDKVVVTIE